MTNFSLVFSVTSIAMTLAVFKSSNIYCPGFPFPVSLGPLVSLPHTSGFRTRSPLPRWGATYATQRIFAENFFFSLGKD